MRRIWLAIGLVALTFVGGAARAAAGDSIFATCTWDGRSAPCTSSWYGAAVTVVWQSSAAVQPQPDCTFDVEIPFNVNTSTQLSCAATFDDGQRISAVLPLNVEVSTPTTTATPDRPPDSNGWYNHPVTVAFTGSAFSGIAGCSAPQTYAGPAGSGIPVAGSCTDNAGKTAGATLPINYDATPPSLTLTASSNGRGIDLHWSAASAPAPLAGVQLVRSAGPGTPAGIVSTSAVGSLSDSAVTPGVAYTYTLTASDAAGNTASQAATATVPPAPAATAGHSGPRSRPPATPLLRWRPVRGATYYNVQLYRGHKILSAWPRVARLRLRRSWRYEGRRQSLRPGRYRWYAWPGYGPRSRDRYGRLAARGSFVIP